VHLSVYFRLKITYQKCLSDTLQAQFGDDSLRYSILAGTGFYIIASVLFFLAARWLEQDWED